MQTPIWFTVKVDVTSSPLSDVHWIHFISDSKILNDKVDSTLYLVEMFNSNLKLKE